MNEFEARIERLTGCNRNLEPCWSIAPVVEATQAMRGVSLIVASALVAEVGDMCLLLNNHFGECRNSALTSNLFTIIQSISKRRGKCPWLFGTRALSSKPNSMYFANVSA